MLLVDRNFNKIVNAEAVDKVAVDHTMPKKISRKVPSPQPVPKRTCRKSVFTTSLYVTENKTKRNEDEVPAKEHEGDKADNLAGESSSKPSFDIGF